MEEKNADYRFACPRNHLDTQQAGTLVGNQCTDEKYFCPACNRFFYVDTMNGDRVFSDGMSFDYQYQTDGNLSPKEGFREGSEGIIEKIS